MKLPVIRGLIDRRILASYRIDASVAARLVPAPFRPQLIHGFAVAGICLIRLKQIRPWFFPWRWGIESENAAHRIAVEWTENGTVRQGVYIPRRDTSSRINTWVGGTIFPGVHYHSRFDVLETADTCQSICRVTMAQRGFMLQVTWLPSYLCLRYLPRPRRLRLSFNAVLSATRRHHVPASGMAWSCAARGGMYIRWRSSRSSLLTLKTRESFPWAQSHLTTRF